MLSSEGINVLQNAELNVFDKDFLDGEGNVSGEGNLKRARDYLGEMVKFMGNNS